MAASSEDRAATPVIACIGDIDIDWLMQVDRLPAHDDKLPAHSLVRRPGGMAANVAVAVRRLGGESRLIGRVGDDPEGRDLLVHLRGEGVDVSRVATIAGERTFQCLVFIGPEGERSLVRLPSALIVPGAVDIDEASLVGCSHVHLTFTDLTVTGHVAELARGLGCSISIDIEQTDLPRDPVDLKRLLASVDLAFMNRRTRHAAERHGAFDGFQGALVTTLGADGARFERSGVSIDSAGYKVAVRDTTGAGDAFAGAFLMSWLVDRDDPRTSLDRANRIAAHSTREIGAQTGVLEEAAFQVPGSAPLASRARP